MVLSDYITEDRIVTDFAAADKADALAGLCRLAARIHGLPYERILDVVRDREAVGSTGLGGGVALPHGRSPDVPHPVLVMALASRGVDFDSLDGKPVRVFVLILTPLTGDRQEHLQILARLGGLFKSRAAVEEVLTASTPAEVYDFLARRG